MREAIVEIDIREGLLSHGLAELAVALIDRLDVLFRVVYGCLEDEQALLIVLCYRR